MKRLVFVILCLALGAADGPEANVEALLNDFAMAGAVGVGSAYSELVDR